MIAAHRRRRRSGKAAVIDPTASHPKGAPLARLFRCGRCRSGELHGTGVRIRCRGPSTCVTTHRRRRGSCAATTAVRRCRSGARRRRCGDDAPLRAVRSRCRAHIGDESMRACRLIVADRSHAVGSSSPQLRRCACVFDERVEKKSSCGRGERVASSLAKSFSMRVSEHDRSSRVSNRGSAHDRTSPSRRTKDSLRRKIFFSRSPAVGSPEHAFGQRGRNDEVIDRSHHAMHRCLAWCARVKPGKPRQHYVSGLSRKIQSVIDWTSRRINVFYILA